MKGSEDALRFKQEAGCPLEEDFTVCTGCCLRGIGHPGACLCCPPKIYVSSKFQATPPLQQGSLCPRPASTLLPSLVKISSFEQFVKYQSGHPLKEQLVTTKEPASGNEG